MKSLRRDLCEAVVEAHHVRALDSVPRQQLELFPQRREPCGRLVGREELPRMRLERHRAGHESARACGIRQPGEHGLMADVNAVEIADRQRGGGSRSDRHAAQDTHGIARGAPVKA